ncbi:MAG TPA: AAA family ATPase [Ignavibacteria bacterium]|nr:AAA family ATPase [Ignavibacteria bacterium]
MFKKNYFVLTGAMGAGKSTILKYLKEKNFLCIEEPARQIIKEQRSIDGEGIYYRNSQLFVQLMLSRSMHQYISHLNYDGPVIFDRGIPDIMAHAQGKDMDIKPFFNASEFYLYNKNVFMFSGWEEIYKTDEDRKMDFKSAERFGVNVLEIYSGFGYNIIGVPLTAIEKRVEFIINSIKSFT